MKPKVIDLRGLRCPEPLKRAEEELGLIKEGVLAVLVNSPSNHNIERLAKKLGIGFKGVKYKDHYKLTLKKTRQPKKIAKTEEKPGILLVVSTDTMGKEQDIGRVLMKGFFETMKVTGEVPHTIFFLNAGVKLTTTNNDTVPLLKELEAMGVEVFSCGTCLKHYGLEAELKVGWRGTTTHIVEGIKDFAKVVWI